MTRSAKTTFGLTNKLLQSKLDLKVLIRICQILVTSGEIPVNGNILVGVNKILTRYLNMELMFHFSQLIDVCRWELFFLEFQNNSIQVIGRVLHAQPLHASAISPEKSEIDEIMEDYLGRKEEEKEF